MDINALLGLGMETEEDTAELARQLRGQKDASDFFALSTIEPMAKTAQAASDNTLASAQAAGGLRKAQAAAAAKAEQDRLANERADAAAQLDADRFAYEKANDEADRLSAEQIAAIESGAPVPSASEMTQMGRRDQFVEGLAGMKEVMGWTDPETGVTEYDPSKWIGYWDKVMAGGITNPLATKEGQQYQKWASRLKEGALRTATGAAAPEGENAEYIATLIPGFGDDPETIAMNMRLLEQYEDTLNKMLVQFPYMSDEEAAARWNSVVEKTKASDPNYTPPDAAVAAPQTEEDFAAIPKGGRYIDPDDGLEYIKD